MDPTEPMIFPPYRLVAEFSDGVRLLFDGLTEPQAREQMEAAQARHGDIVWLDGVTDQNYTGGVYHKLLPPPAVFPFPLLDANDMPE